MATLAEIQTQIELGWRYYVEQLEAIRLEMVSGCFVCTTAELTCLSSTILVLEYEVETENNTDLTTRTYDLLLHILSGFSGSFVADPTVQIPGLTILSSSTVSILQTGVAFPGDGVSTYTFPELIGTTVLTVYRGTGTVLRARTTAPDNEYAQINYSTGAVTVSYDFSAGEGLWVEYKTTL